MLPLASSFHPLSGKIVSRLPAKAWAASEHPLFPSPLGENCFQTPPLRSLAQQGFQGPNRRTYFLQRKIILIQRVLEAESQSG
jgi:hypothetical protein